jgi:hypothetical protein
MGRGVAVCKTVCSTLRNRGSVKASQTRPSWSGFAPEWPIWAPRMRAAPGTELKHRVGSSVLGGYGKQFNWR